MNIFIMRHGEAEVMANSDKARRLTAYGIKQAFTQGQWLRKQLELATPDRIIISPYVRAQETFEQVNQAFNGLGRCYTLWPCRNGDGLFFCIA